MGSIDGGDDRDFCDNSPAWESWYDNELILSMTGASSSEYILEPMVLTMMTTMCTKAYMI